MLRHEQACAPDDAELLAVRAFLLDEDGDDALDAGDPASLPRSDPVTVSDKAPMVSDKAPNVFTNIAPKVSNNNTPVRVHVRVWQPRMINTSRERMQNEIASLRQQEIALKQRLKALQRGGTDRSQDVMHVAWQTIAHDQQAQREAVEKERDMLRTMIKRNKRSLQCVWRFLEKVRLPKSIPVPRSCELPPVVEIEAAFAEVSDHLGTMYARIDSVFQQSEIDRLIDEIHDLRIENDMTPRLTVESRNARVLPFDVKTTADAMWRHRHARAAAFAHGAHQVLVTTTDSIRRRFDMTIRFQSYDGLAFGFSETRRFVHLVGHVILYCAIGTRTSDIVGGNIRGFRYLLLNWTLIRSPRKPLLTYESRSVSHVEVFEEMKPIHSSVVDPRERSVQELREARDFCAETVTELQRLERQAVENLLLDLTRRGPASSLA